MPDWQLSTLRALGQPVRGLAGGSLSAREDPLTSPVAPAPDPLSTRLDPLPAPTAPAPPPQAAHAAPDRRAEPPAAPPADQPPVSVPLPDVPFTPDILGGQGVLSATAFSGTPSLDVPAVQPGPSGGALSPGVPAGPEGTPWAGPPGAVSLTPIADELMRRMRHGDPLTRRVGRGVRRAVGARAAREVREQEAAAGILGQVVSSCRRIAVTSLRGGAGKSTVTALVARTVAAHRGDRTLVMDADPSLGSLPLRLGLDPDRSYRGVSTLPHWEAAQSYLTQAGERLWVASASAARALAGELSLTEFQTAQGEFSRYFGVCLVDCGPGLTSELNQGVLSSSHAQILVSPATVDGALSTRSALDWFQRGPNAHLLQRTLVVLVTHTPHTDGDLGRSRALLSAEGVPVIHLPYDRHLAAGSSVDPALLAETSGATAVHLATAAFTRALR